MARLSKSQCFAVYEATGMPTPDSTHGLSFDEAVRRLESDGEEDENNEKNNQDERVVLDARTHHHTHNSSEAISLLRAPDEEHTQLPNLEYNHNVLLPTMEPAFSFPFNHRESTLTMASISSLPESCTDTDLERALPPMHKPYTPPMVRPSFRRPESVRRMQMASPTPSFERSPRRFAGARPKSGTPRSGTPRSAKSSTKKASGAQRRRRKGSENQEVEAYGTEEGEDGDGNAHKKEYPLVLLHVTLLPVSLRWSEACIQALLPPQTLASLQLLRAKVSDTVLQRGILIPHPQAEYELLEERLLEALELTRERLTKCGHFRGRDSADSLSSFARESVENSDDSGVGSSLDTASSHDGECPTCHRRVKAGEEARVSGGRRKWSVKVFAANGLMRAPAWAAAWAEMERVDVEILPWIADEVRVELDRRMEELGGEEEARRMEEENDDEDEEARIREMAEEQVRLTQHYRPREDDVRTAFDPPAIARYPRASYHQPDNSSAAPPPDLPDVYRPKDIPLPLLLRNYVFLLAQDTRNLAIFGLVALTLFIALRAALIPRTVLEDLVPLTVFDTASSSVHAVHELILDTPGAKTVEVPSEAAADAHADAYRGIAPAEQAGAGAEDQALHQAAQTLEACQSPKTPVTLDWCENPVFAARLFGGLEWQGALGA